MPPIPLTADMPPEVERPAPEAVISGDPVTTTWSAHEDGGVMCGTWEATVGSWRVAYDEWEYVRMLSGRCAVVDADGTRHEYGPGDSFMIPRGFRGVWEVLEPMRKEYVIVP